MDVHILSGGLTVMTIFLAVAVLLEWKSSTSDAVLSKEELTSVQWLIVGVWVAFLGQTLDNIYWLIAWTMHYFNAGGEAATWLFNNGINFNIPFRQALGIFAAYCHLRAAQSITNVTNFKTKNILVVSCLVGVAYSCWMVFA